MGGIGSGIGGGGKKPGAGRPKGSRNKRTAALIEEAERSGQLLPVDFLLEVMRDPDAEMRDRMSAAGMAAPYCHARLTVLPAYPDPRHMDDTAMASQLARLEQRNGGPADELLVEQVESLLDSLDNLDQVPAKRREALFRKLLAIGAAGLEQLAAPDRPGKVPPQGAARPVGSPDPAAAPITRPTRSAHQAAADAAPGPLDGRRLRYDAATGKLEPVR